MLGQCFLVYVLEFRPWKAVNLQIHYVKDRNSGQVGGGNDYKPLFDCEAPIKKLFAHIEMAILSTHGPGGLWRSLFGLGPRCHGHRSFRWQHQAPTPHPPRGLCVVRIPAKGCLVCSVWISRQIEKKLLVLLESVKGVYLNLQSDPKRVRNQTSVRVLVYRGGSCV